MWPSLTKQLFIGSVLSIYTSALVFFPLHFNRHMVTVALHAWGKLSKHAATTASEQSSTALTWWRSPLLAGDPGPVSQHDPQPPGGTCSGPGKIVPNIPTSFCFQTVLHAYILRDPHSGKKRTPTWTSCVSLNKGWPNPCLCPLSSFFLSFFLEKTKIKGGW